MATSSSVANNYNKYLKVTSVPKIKYIQNIMMACKPLHAFMKLKVVTISQEFMLMIEKYPRLLVQHQADHIHALGWESLVRNIIYMISPLDCFCGFMLLFNNTTIKLFNLGA